MGTPEFSVPCLERLIADGHEVVLAVTQADKPKGRGYELTPPPVKVCALSHGIEVYQPRTLKTEEAIQRLSSCQPDLAVVVAYGKILSQTVLDIPRLGCINVHASLLPKYRGAAPIQWAVLNGEKQSGVTTMKMDAGIDTGDMLMQRAIAIGPDITASELHDALSLLGAQTLSDTLKALEQGTLTATPQDHSQFTYAPMLSKELSPIDWSREAAEIHNQVRGLNPWPCALTTMGGKTLKIHVTRPCEGKHLDNDAKPGQVLSQTPLILCCGNQTKLEITEVQLEGARRLPAADFVRGHPLMPGRILPD